MKMIFAGNLREARRFAEENKFAPKNGCHSWEYISSPSSLCGRKNYEVYFVGTYSFRKDYIEIMDRLLLDIECGACSPYMANYLRLFLAYEIRSSWWASFFSNNFLQKLVVKYFAWKVKRKYKLFVNFAR